MAPNNYSNPQVVYAWKPTLKLITLLVNRLLLFAVLLKNLNRELAFPSR